MTRVACRRTRQPALGTIVGIMERCHALAAGGVSDPAAVSRGIGTGLVATPVGIASALQRLWGTTLSSSRARDDRGFQGAAVESQALKSHTQLCRSSQLGHRDALFRAHMLAAAPPQSSRSRTPLEGQTRKYRSICQLSGH
jgi:hypothetical protein